MNWRLRLRTLWQDLQSSLWFRPAVTTLFAFLLAIAITTIDQLPYFAAPSLLRIGIESARALLAAIAGAMLTVVGMVFSTLMIVLVLASQQFSPRILRNFARDPISQNVLSIFMGSFTYSLLVLARTSEYEDRVFTPVFSITVAFAWALVAIGAFIFFIDHIAKTVRASYIIADINRQSESSLHRYFHAQDDAPAPAPNHAAHAPDDAGQPDMQAKNQASDEEVPPGEAATATHIYAPRAGHIQTVDEAMLVRIATERELVIQVERRVGEFISRNALLLSLLPEQKMSQELLDALHSAFDIGTERTMYGDAPFGIRQLVDIALKAISPAINDPTTAVDCINYLANLLSLAARHPDPSGRLYDEAGKLRLILPMPTFGMMLDLAFNQIRHYSSREVTITLRLLDALAEIAQATNDPTRRGAIWQHVAMISRSVDRSIHEPVERAKINARLQEIAARCGASPGGVELDDAEPPPLPPAAPREAAEARD